MFRKEKQTPGGNAKPGIRPERVLCCGFLLLILAGGLLLSLPIAAKGERINLAQALFTSTSAVCVTGLVVTDTGTTFSLFGQLVLLALIQTGGLGFMVFTTLAMAALGRRITLRERVLIRESLNAATLSGLVRLTGWYGLLTLLIEGAGAALLAVRFVPLFGWQRGLYFSLWHAVSAFCNAGFDLFGGYASLTGFQQEPWVLLVFAGLIVLGGTGFAVITEVLEVRFRWKAISLHGRMVLLLSVGLLCWGALIYSLVEWQTGVLADIPGGGNKLVNAFFQSATMRTAGFNSVNLASLSDAAKLVSSLLMITGASPASTGGGVKTTTMAVLLLAVWAMIRGETDAHLFHKRIPEGTVRRALAVVAVFVLVWLTGTLILALAEGDRVAFIDLLFETASASATVGVTSIGTASLTGVSKVTLALLMYLGRVGPMTLALAVASRQEVRSHVRYPEEEIIVG